MTLSAASRNSPAGREKSRFAVQNRSPKDKTPIFISRLVKTMRVGQQQNGSEFLPAGSGMAAEFGVTH